MLYNLSKYYDLLEDLDKNGIDYSYDAKNKMVFVWEKGIFIVFSDSNGQKLAHSIIMNEETIKYEDIIEKIKKSKTLAHLLVFKKILREFNKITRDFQKSYYYCMYSMSNGTYLNSSCGIEFTDCKSGIFSIMIINDGKLPNIVIRYKNHVTNLPHTVYSVNVNDGNCVKQAIDVISKIINKHNSTQHTDYYIGNIVKR